ncbi:hypothetical protein [Petrachloros mirabilis]
MSSRNDQTRSIDAQHTEDLSRRGFLLKGGSALALLAMMDS